MITSHSRPGDPPVVLGRLYRTERYVSSWARETRLTNGNGAAEIGAAQGGLPSSRTEATAFLAHLAELEADADAHRSVDGFQLFAWPAGPHHALSGRRRPTRSRSPPAESESHDLHNRAIVTARTHDSSAMIHRLDASRVARSHKRREDCLNVHDACRFAPIVEGLRKSCEGPQVAVLKKHSRIR